MRETALCPRGQASRLPPSRIGDDPTGPSVLICCCLPVRAARYRRRHPVRAAGRSPQLRTPGAPVSPPCPPGADVRCFMHLVSPDDARMACGPLSEINKCGECTSFHNQERGGFLFQSGAARCESEERVIQSLIWRFPAIYAAHRSPAVREFSLHHRLLAPLPAESADEILQALMYLPEHI